LKPHFHTNKIQTFETSSEEASPRLSTPNAANIALIVVTYYPGALFIKRIQSAASQFKLVVLVDNSESEQQQQKLRDLESGNFNVILNQSNVGLGNALNAGCKRAMELDCEWSVTLDQDTELCPDFLSGMLEAWKDSCPSTVLLGSNYYNVSRSAFRVAPSSVPLAHQKITVITSGCLTHLPTWSAIGMFRGDYFIDSIDHEFCLRARQAGFTVAINSQARMKHTIGDKLEYRMPIAKLAPYRHSIGRKYTSARNSLRTVIDYASREPLWCVKTILGMTYELIAIIFLEPDKRLRLRAFSLGLLHGCRGILGPVPAQLRDLE